MLKIMLKRIWFIMALFLMCIFPAFPWAQTVTLTVISASGERGTGGNPVAVTMDNSVGIAQITFRLKYDGIILDVTGAEVGQRVSSEPGVSFNWSSPEPGLVDVSIGSQFGAAVAAGSGTVVTLSFEVADDAPVGDVPLTVSDIFAFEPPNQAVPATSVDGSFAVFVSPHLGLSQQSHDFGGVLVGNTDVWTLTVFNAGSDTLIVDSLFSTRLEFDLDLPNFPQVLDADSGFDVHVTFIPQSMEIVSGRIRVLSNDPDSSVFSIPVTGEGLQPDIALSESSHDYGQVPLDSPSEWSLVIYNLGTAPLAVTEATTDDAHFAVTSPTFPKVIRVGDSLEVVITFSTSSEGSFSATVTVISADPDEGNLRISLSAQGVRAPDIEVSTMEYDYGQVLVRSSANWSLHIANVGSEDLNISQISFDVSDFIVISHAFPQTLPAGDYIDVSIMFSPSLEGSITGQMSIVSDDPDEGDLVVTLRGEGVIPNLELSATSYDYGGVIIGTSSEWVLTISNGGSGPLTIPSITSNHSDFSVTSPAFPQTVTSGASIDVTVTFTPSGDGLVSASLTISSNDPDEPTIRITLDGESLVPDIELSDLSHHFGDVNIDSLAVWTVLLSNMGTAPLTVDNVTSNHPTLTVVSPSFPQTVGLSESIEVTVHFVPTRQEIVTALLTILSNDPVEGTVVIELIGNGIPPVTLRVDRTVGEPGMENVFIPIVMDNVVPVAQVEFSLLYDPMILSVSNVTRSERVTGMGTFSWSRIEPGQIVVLLSDFTGQVISPGSGPIADINVSVAEPAPPITIDMSLTGAAFFDSEGKVYESRTLDGLFTVIVEDIHLLQTEYDFGEVGVGLSVGWDLLIHNVGTKELTIDSLVSDRSDFDVPSLEFPQTLPPSGNLEATVVFAPSVLGRIGGHLRLISSDPDEESVTITLSGEGVAAAVLQVGGGSGEVGSSDNLVEIQLQNRMDVYGLECVLSYDSEKLSVTEVQPSDRSESLDLFSWTAPTEEQVRVVISGLGGAFIPAGEGSVADIFFAVDMNAPREEVPLSLSGIAVFDSAGEHVVSAAVGGFFLVTGADILLKEVEHTFEYVAPGDSGMWQMYIFNEGTSPLTLDHVSSDNPAFVVSAPEFPQTVIPEESLAVTVLFVPSDTGTVEGELQVVSNDPDEGTLVVLLRGRSAVPHISVPVRAYSYGTVEVSTSAEWFLTVFCHGLVALTISDISIDRAEFEVAWPIDFPQVVDPGESIDTIIRFSPADTGDVVGTLTIMSDDPDEPSLTISLSGKGGILVPDIALSSVEHDFGSVVLGSSADWFFSIGNEGLVDLTLQTVVCNIEEFTVVSPDFPLVLAPNTMASVLVLFTPSSLEHVEGILTISSNDPDEGHIFIPLKGEGVTAPVPEISLSAHSHYFGHISVGQTSDWELKISNGGTDDLSIYSASVSHSEFSVVSPALPEVLPPDSEMTLRIRFAPLSTGQKAGQLYIASNDPDEDTVTVQVSGDGLPSTLTPEIGLLIEEHHFGTVKVGDESAWSFQISNTGLADLIVDSVYSDHSNFQVRSPVFPISIHPGGGQVVEVVFTPSSEGLKAGALAIFSNDPKNPLVFIFLSGEGETQVAVQLLSFTAAHIQGLVVLTWETRAGRDQCGFHLLRQGDLDAQYHLLTHDGLIKGSNPYTFTDSNIEDEGLYQYQLVAVNEGGGESIVGYTSVKVDGLIPSEITLSQNYPNPFNPETRIEYVLDKDGRVDLSICNMLGQRVKTLVAQHQKAGTYSVIWYGDDVEGRAVNSGVYIAQLRVGEEAKRIKMMVLK